MSDFLEKAAPVAECPRCKKKASEQDFMQWNDRRICRECHSELQRYFEIIDAAQGYLFGFHAKKYPTDETFSCPQCGITKNVGERYDGATCYNCACGRILQGKVDFFPYDEHNEILLPVSLFTYKTSQVDEYGGYRYTCFTDDVVMVEPGKLCARNTAVSGGGGKMSLYLSLPFEDLPKLIRYASLSSPNPVAERYVGMTEENWQDYVKEPIAKKSPSRFPTVKFGNLEWYVLKSKEEKTLLLSVQGVNSIPWNQAEEVIPWEACSLRQWIAQDFLEETFSEKELAALIPFEDGDLVSIPDEAFVKAYLKGDSAVTVTPSETALKNGAKTYVETGIDRNYRQTSKMHVGNSAYWLKDVQWLCDKPSKTIRTVSELGFLGVSANTSEGITVRPILQVDLNRLSTAEVKKMFEFEGDYREDFLRTHAQLYETILPQWITVEGKSHPLDKCFLLDGEEFFVSCCQLDGAFITVQEKFLSAEQCEKFAEYRHRTDTYGNEYRLPITLLSRVKRNLSEDTFPDPLSKKAES